MVTGANSGIGKATVLGLAEMGAKVILVCRCREKGETAIKELKEKTGNESLELLIADLSLMSSVRKLANEFKNKYSRLDVLILNAGAYFVKRKETEEGIERTAAVNYLSRFLLTNLLLENLRNSSSARIISIVGSMVKEINFDDFQMNRNYKGRFAVAQFTLANILFIHELIEKEEMKGITANYYDPGAVRTEMAEKDADISKLVKFTFKLFKPFFKSPKKAAKMILYLASSKEIQNTTGRFYTSKKEISPPNDAYNDLLRKQLWDISVELSNVEK